MPIKPRKSAKATDKSQGVVVKQAVDSLFMHTVQQVADKWFRKDGSSKTRATTSTMIRQTMKDHDLEFREAAEVFEKAMLLNGGEHVVGGPEAYWEMVDRMEGEGDSPGMKMLRENHNRILAKFGLSPTGELRKSEPMDQAKVIAVDLNRTLAQGAGPNDFGEPTEGAAEAMQRLKDEGYEIAVNSVVGDAKRIREWLDEHGIPHDHVNWSPTQPAGSSGKMHAAAYLDDKAVPFRGDWEETLADLFSCGVLEKSVVIGRPETLEATADSGYVRRRFMGGTVQKKLAKGQPTGIHDDDKRVITWVLTTETDDRDGETINPEGGRFDNFARHPTVQFNHDIDSFGIGSLSRKVSGPVPEGFKPVHPDLSIWNEEIGEGTRFPDVGGPKRMALLGNVYFSKENPQGDLAYRMAKELGHGAGSISFNPVGTAVKRNDSGGNHYDEFELLEFTVCPLGSNVDAVALVKAFKGIKDKTKKPIDQNDHSIKRRVLRKSWVVRDSNGDSLTPNGFGYDEDARLFSTEASAKRQLKIHQDAFGVVRDPKSEEDDWVITFNGRAFNDDHYDTEANAKSDMEVYRDDMSVEEINDQWIITDGTQFWNAGQLTTDQDSAEAFDSADDAKATIDEALASSKAVNAGFHIENAAGEFWDGNGFTDDADGRMVFETSSEAKAVLSGLKKFRARIVGAERLEKRFKVRRKSVKKSAMSKSADWYEEKASDLPEIRTRVLTPGGRVGTVYSYGGSKSDPTVRVAFGNINREGTDGFAEYKVSDVRFSKSVDKVPPGRPTSPGNEQGWTVGEKVKAKDRISTGDDLSGRNANKPNELFADSGESLIVRGVRNGVFVTVENAEGKRIEVGSTLIRRVGNRTRYASPTPKSRKSALPEVQFVQDIDQAGSAAWTWFTDVLGFLSKPIQHAVDYAIRHGVGTGSLLSGHLAGNMYNRGLSPQEAASRIENVADKLWWVEYEGMDQLEGPFADGLDATRAAAEHGGRAVRLQSRKAKGRKMKKTTKRKLWKNRNKGWVLKSDGPLDEAAMAVIDDMGIDDVTVSEEEPDGAGWVEEEIEVESPVAEAIEMIENVVDVADIPAAVAALKEALAAEKNIDLVNDNAEPTVEEDLVNVMEEGAPIEEACKALVAKGWDVEKVAEAKRKHLAKSIKKTGDYGPMGPLKVVEFVDKGGKTRFKVVDATRETLVTFDSRKEATEWAKRNQSKNKAGTTAWNVYDSQDDLAFGPFATADEANACVGKESPRTGETGRFVEGMGSYDRDHLDNMVNNRSLESEIRRMKADGDDDETVLDMVAKRMLRKAAPDSLSPGDVVRPATSANSAAWGKVVSVDGRKVTVKWQDDGATEERDIGDLQKKSVSKSDDEDIFLEGDEIVTDDGTEGIVVDQADDLVELEVPTGAKITVEAKRCKRRRKSKEEPKSKRLSRSEREDMLKMAEVMEDAAEKSGPSVAAGLRSEAAKARQKAEDPMKDTGDPTPAEEADLLKAMQEVELGRTELSKAFFRETGVRLNGVHL